MVSKGEFKQHLSPKKREIIVKTLKEQYQVELLAGNIQRKHQSMGGDQLDVILENSSNAD